MSDGVLGLSVLAGVVGAGVLIALDLWWHPWRRRR
jgi:hypothetical protein